jgi:hypothetical protein
MGGSDDEENLTPLISIEMHAAFHHDLWEHYGNLKDYIAWKALSGRITGEEARLMAAKIGQQESSKYKDSRKIIGDSTKQFLTKEVCSKGGKIASEKLIEWQKQNKEIFAKKCSDMAKKNAFKRCIPHEFNGVTYESKKALQEATGLSNTGFYSKLKSGKISRLKNEIL